MNCKDCKHYDSEEDYCTYIVCAPGYCEESLPCEKGAINEKLRNGTNDK